jgi:hypothetical protein
VLDLTGANLASYILRTCRDVVSSNPRFRQSLGDVAVFSNNKVSFGDAQIIVKNVTAAGTRLSPDYFMFTQRGRALVAKVADKAGTFLEWIIPIPDGHSWKLIDPGVYYLNVNSVNEQTREVSLNMKKYEWREGGIWNAAGSYIYFNATINTSDIVVTDAVTGDVLVPGTDYLVLPWGILLQSFINYPIITLGSGGTTLTPYADFWYQRPATINLGSSIGGKQLFSLEGTWAKLQITDINGYVLRPNSDYTFTPPSVIRTASWNPPGADLIATGLRIMSPVTPLGFASGVLNSISATDVLFGSISFQIGTGTVYTVYVGAAPNSPPANSFYTGSLQNTLADLAATINTNTATLKVNAAIGTNLSTGFPTLTIAENVGVSGSLTIISVISAFTTSAIHPENTLQFSLSSGESLALGQVFVNTSAESNLTLVVEEDGTVTLPSPLQPGQNMHYEVRIDTGPETQLTVYKRALSDIIVPGFRIALGDSVVVGDQVAIIVSPHICETYDVYGSKDNVNFVLDIKANDYATASEVSELIKQTLLITRRTVMEMDGVTIFEAAREIQGEARDDSGTATRYIATLSVSAMCDWKVFIPLVTRIAAIDVNEVPFYSNYSTKLSIIPRYSEFGVQQFTSPVVLPELIIEINGVPVTTYF